MKAVHNWAKLGQNKNLNIFTKFLFGGGVLAFERVKKMI